MITAAFFETEAQLEVLLERTQGQDPSQILVALSPEADLAAEKRGLSYCTIEDLYSEEDLISRGLRNYASLERLCRIFDGHVENTFGADPNKVFMSCGYHAYSLKRLMDAPLHRVFILYGALTKLRPDRIVHFETKQAAITDSLDYYRGSLCSLALPLIADHLGIDHTRLPNVHGNLYLDPVPCDPNGHALPSLSRYVKLTNLIRVSRVGSLISGAVRHARTGTLTTAVLRRLFRDGRTAVLVAGPLLAYHDIEADIEDNGWRLVRLSEVLLDCEEPASSDNGVRTSQLNALWTALENDHGFRKLFGFEGIDYFPLVRARFRHFVFQVLPRVVRMGRHIQARLKELETALLLGACVTSTEAIACFIAAKQADVPSIVFQHGAYLYNPLSRYHDAILPDYVFTFGRGVSNFITQADGSCAIGDATLCPQAMETGWAVLDELIKTHRKAGHTHYVSRRERPRIMYIMSLPVGDQRYFTHTYPPIRYSRLQRQVIETCSRFSHIQLLAKAYPGTSGAYNLTGAWIEANRFSNVELIRDRKLIDCLDMADLFIVDYPSTTLLQVMATDRRVIAFIDLASYPIPEHALTLLGKRVTLSTCEESFLRDIENILKGDWLELAEPINDEFLCQYGTHLNDGGSRERIGSALRSIAAEKRQRDR